MGMTGAAVTALPLNWEDLQYFLAVARTGQLSRAASLIRTTHVTVGRRIERLEDTLHVQLFERGPKGYALTPAGRQLQEIAERMDDSALRLPDLLTGTSPELGGTIRLNLPEGFCSVFCKRILPEFRRAFPALDLEVVAIQQISSFSPKVADLAVYLDPPRGSPYHTERVADYSLRVYGEASYLEQHPPVKDRDDLLDHPFIGYVEEMIFMPGLDYLAEVNPRIRTQIQCSSIFSQITAVREGLGIAVLPDYLAKAHPDLRPVLPDEVALTRSYWLACRRNLLSNARERAVIERLLSSTKALQPYLMPLT